MKRLMACWIVVVAVLAAGCATTRQEVGSQRIVERLPRNEPEWLGRSTWEETSSYIYVGGVANRSDMALGLREAKAEGEKKLTEQIRQRIRTEFGSALEGQNLDGQTGSYVIDLIAKVSDNVEVSGVTMDESYVEKIEETTGAGVRYVYNCYAKLRLGMDDYAEARRRVLNTAVGRAKMAANAKAEALLRRARMKLEDLPGMSDAAVPAEGADAKADQ